MHFVHTPSDKSLRDYGNVNEIGHHLELIKPKRQE